MKTACPGRNDWRSWAWLKGEPFQEKSFFVNSIEVAMGLPIATFYWSPYHRPVNGKIVEEWMLFNEFAVMQQIYRD